MARTLRRPMFRIGGMAHEQRTGYMGGGMTGVMSGIMPTQPDAGLTPRMGYAVKGKVESFEDLQTKNRIKQEIQNKSPFLSPTQIDDEYNKYVEGLDYEAGILEDFEDSGTGPRSVFEKKQTDLDTARSEEGKKSFIADLTAKEKEKEKKLIKEGVIGSDESVFPREDKPEIDASDLPTVPTETTRTQFENFFNEYLPVIEEQLKPDEDESRRQKYLALAKFGSGLLSQPGGDLVGAIGKAADKPLTDLSKVMAQESKDKRTPKLLALQAALDRMKQLNKGRTDTETRIDAQTLDKIAVDVSSNSSMSYETGLIVAEKLTKLKKDKSEYAGKFNEEFPSGDNAQKKIDKIVGPKFYYTEEGDLKVVKDGDIYSLDEWDKESKKK